MTRRALATDLDRTLTRADLTLDPRALDCIDGMRQADVRVILATGRRLDEVVEMGLASRVDAIVAENGAVLSIPQRTLLEVVGEGFAASARDALGELADRFHWGRVVGSGPRELSQQASRALADRGIVHEAIYNAEEVMLLPAGVDKASGVARALDRLDLTDAEVWAIGDGENDVTMLETANISAVPRNAVPQARAAADLLLVGEHSDGFIQFASGLLGTIMAKRVTA